ncbi:MAG: hypothetical protein R3D05_16220 [Dongiaceae bacterium]
MTALYTALSAAVALLLLAVFMRNKSANRPDQGRDTSGSND